MRDSSSTSQIGGENQNSGDLVSLAHRIAHTRGLVVVSAPPGFRKSFLLDEALTLLGKIDELGSSARKLTGSPGSNHESITDAITNASANDVLVISKLNKEDASGLGVILKARTALKTCPHVWVAIDRASDLAIGRLFADQQAELIDYRSLLISESETRIRLTRIPGALRKVVGQLAEGWPAALSLLSRWAQSTSIENASWNAADIVEASGLGPFIAQEVIPLLHPSELEALVRVSVVGAINLEAIEGGDAEVRRGVISASRSLAGLIVREGDKIWVQPAFQAWLRDRFEERPAEEKRAILEKTASSLAELGHLTDAAALLRQAGRPQKIIELVRANGALHIWVKHDFPTIKCIVEHAGEPVVAQSETLQLMRCLVFMKAGQIGEAQLLFARIRRAPAVDDISRRDREIVRVTLLIYGCGLQREGDLEQIRQIVATSAGEPGWRSLLATFSCILNSQRARFDAAQASLIEARVHARNADSRYNLMFLSLHEASMMLAKGELKLARIAIGDARKRWRAEFPEDRGVETVISALSASVEYELGQVTAARGSVRRSAYQMPDSEAWLDVYAAAYEPMARIIMMDHGLGPALEALEDQRRKLEAHGVPRVASLLLNLSHVLTGEAWLRSAEVGASPKDGISPIEPTATWHEKEAHTLALVFAMVRRGENAAADEMLSESISLARRLGVKRSMLRFRLARCGLLLREGRDKEADIELEHALKLGAQQGAKQVFAHYMGPGMAKAIAGIVASKSSGRSRIARFGSTLGLRQGVSDESSSMLSKREREVLAALAEGGSDKVLGRILGMSEHGVRFHLKSIYRKLDVHDRASAAHKGRIAGII